MSADESNNNNNNNVDLEKAFGLIQEGNALEEAEEHWKAAESFANASTMLDRLKQQNASGDDDQKIASLYRQKSLEYWKRARGALIAALTNEEIENKKESTEVVSDNLLSDEECRYRMNLFGRLFAQQPVSTSTTDTTDDVAVKQQESSLEERLRHLSQSLPSSVKSEAERIRDLNQGLRRLGLSTIQNNTNNTNNATTTIAGRTYGLMDEAAAPKSELEQVDDIIAQARDEVKISGTTLSTKDAALAEAAAAGTTTPDVADTLLDHIADDDNNDDDDSMENSSDDDDNDDDVVLDPQVRQDLQNRLLAAQVSLSELIALFEVDTDDDAEIEFEPVRGKKLLKDTRLLLRQVNDKWSAAAR